MAYYNPIYNMTKNQKKEYFFEQRIAQVIAAKGCDIAVANDFQFLIHDLKLCMDIAWAEFKEHEIKTVEYIETLSTDCTCTDIHNHPALVIKYRYQFCLTCFKKTEPFCAYAVNTSKSKFLVKGCDTYLFLLQDQTKIEVK